MTECQAPNPPMYCVACGGTIEEGDEHYATRYNLEVVANGVVGTVKTGTVLSRRHKGCHFPATYRSPAGDGFELGRRMVDKPRLSGDYLQREPGRLNELPTADRELLSGVESSPHVGFDLTALANQLRC